MKYCRIILTGLILLCTLACTKSNDEDKALAAYQSVPVNQIFETAKQAYHNKEYTKAIEGFEALGMLYPFGPTAERGQLYLVKSYYQKSDYISTVAASDRFIQLYPRNKMLDEVYYYKAMANFNQPRGVMAKVFKIDPSYRAPGTMRASYDDFMILIKRFPHSKYQSVAREKLKFLNNMFAHTDLHIAQYYYDRHKWVAAINRAQIVVKKYPNTKVSLEAYTLLINANQKLGFLKQASMLKARRVTLKAKLKA